VVDNKLVFVAPREVAIETDEVEGTSVSVTDGMMLLLFVGTVIESESCEVKF
jgi:hypothetical protein